MLSMFHGALGGWIAKIFIALLVLSFAVWGVSGSILGGVGNAVVTVGETNVSLLDYRLAYDRQLNLLQRQLNTRLSREQADAFGLSQSVLAQVTSGALLDESAREMGLGISKDELAGLIGEDEAFRDATGNFSRAQLQQALRSIGMSQEAYINNREAVAVRGQIIEGTATKTNLPDSYWKILSAYQREKRVFEYANITDRNITPIPTPTEEQLKTSYDENLNKYRAPEYRKLVIVKLEASDIADEEAVHEDDVIADYESRKSSYTQPEKRQIQQLVFSDEETALAAVEKLNSGATFETILSDEGKSEKDVEFGTLAATEIPDQAIRDAAFELNLNQVSEVVQGIFGPVLLRVTEIQSETTRPFEEVKDDIRKALALEIATDELFDTHDKLEDERGAGETLSKAAEIVGLKPRLIEAIDRSALTPQGQIISDIPQSQTVLEQAFETAQGIEADPISIGSDGFVWFEVAGVTSDRQKTQDEVNIPLRKDWNEAEKLKSINLVANKIKEELNNGASFSGALENLSSNFEGVEKPDIKTSAELVRTDTSRDLSNQAISAGFSADDGSVHIATVAEGVGSVVLQVSKVVAGPEVPLAQNIKDEQNISTGNDIVAQLVAKLQETKSVNINRQAIQAALSDGASY